MFAFKSRIIAKINYFSMATARKASKRVQVAFENDESQQNNLKPTCGSQKSSQPANWRDVYKNIEIMRKQKTAPVDTMGCERCHDEEADAKTQRFQILVSLMMSSMTKDETTFGACQRLKTIGFNAKSIAAAEIQDLEKLIHPVGFYKTKAKNIKNASIILVKDFDSDIPNSIEQLLKLPGVGPKMAHIAMKSCWGICSGIGVDVHVHRIANRLGWTSKPTTDPEKTRLELESWLPPELWSSVNLMLVGFGQTVCSAQSPKCSECLVNNLCPSAFKNESPKKKKK